MKNPLLLLALIGGLGASVVYAQSTDDVPGYDGDNPNETRYSDGKMFDDAEDRALTGPGMDGEAARTVTDSFTKRAFIPTKPNEEWFQKSKRGNKNASDFITLMGENYSGCTGGTSKQTDIDERYSYSCQAPAFRNKHGTLARLAPVCTDKRTSCWTITSQTSLIPYKYDGARWITLGKKGANSIPDNRSRTRINYFNATLTFDVQDLRDIRRFKMADIIYEDFIEIKFNGVSVFTDLDRAQYTNVATCGGCHVINRRVSKTLNFDLLPFLQEGSNTFSVRLTAVAHGELYLKIDTDAACCRAWRDDWPEFTP